MINSTERNIGIAVAIVILVLFGSVFFSAFGDIGGGLSSEPNSGGAMAAAPIDPVDPATKAIVDSLNAFSKDENYLNDTSKLTAFKTSINEMIIGINADDPRFAKVQNREKVLESANKMLETITAIESVAKSDPAKAKELITTLFNLRTELLTLAFPDIQGSFNPPKDGFALPIKESDITGFGNSSHNRTKDRPNSKKGHGPLLTATNSFGADLKESLGSGTDISAHSGSPIYAAFSGTILRRSSCIHKSCTDGGYIVLQSTDKRYVAAYLHVTSTVKTGDTIEVGNQIGNVQNINYDHLHFELWVDGYVIWSGKQQANANEDIWNNQKKALGF